MGISDWSSDGCSSDLRLQLRKVNGPMPSTLTVKLDAAEGVAMISPIECGNSRHQGGYGVRQKASGSDADHVQGIEHAGLDHDRVLADFQVARGIGAADVLAQQGAGVLVIDLDIEHEARSEEHTSELQSLMR